MHRAIIVAILVIAAIILIRYLRRRPLAARHLWRIRYVIYGTIGLAVAFAAVGKVSWLVATVAVMIPVISKMAVWGLRLLPLLQQWLQYKKMNRGRPYTQTTLDPAVIDYQEALLLFGLTAAATKQQIIRRHRELIQKNHPDRGGSDYLAAKINAAKKVLLDAAKQ